MAAHTPSRIVGVARTLALALAVVLPAACEEEGGSTTSGTQLSENPQSVLGKAAGAGRDVARGIERTQQGTAGLADNLAGADAVAVGGVRFPIPPGWKSVAPSNSMREAQLAVPTPQGECLVTFSRVGGSADENIARWANQVLDDWDKPVKPRTAERMISGVRVTTAELHGLYLENAAFGSTTRREDWIVRGAIVEARTGNVVVKMTGPYEAMRAALDGWNRLIGGLAE